LLLETAMEEHTFRARVRADFAGGARSGVNGTPTFFINGERHNGPFDFDSLSKAIERKLKSHAPSMSE
jgi:protein-disulfide isomerase